MEIALLAPDGAFMSSVGTALDALVILTAQSERSYPEDRALSRAAHMRLITVDGGPVRLADGRRLTADGSIRSSTRFDVVHVANFRIGSHDALRERLAGYKPLFDWLRDQVRQGAILSASGTGSFLLAEAGLLAGIPVPLPRAVVPLCRDMFPRIRLDHARSIIEDGKVILGSGQASEPALMVRLIERCLSESTGRWLAAVTGLDRIAEGRLTSDPLVASAQIWLELRFSEDFRIADLAAELSTSHQTLIRRFTRELGMGPRDYVQHLRVEAAKRLLSGAGRSVDEIAALVGYKESRSFRLLFKAATGDSPTAYRRRLRAMTVSGTGAAEISHP